MIYELTSSRVSRNQLHELAVAHRRIYSFFHLRRSMPEAGLPQRSMSPAASEANS